MSIKPTMEVHVQEKDPRFASEVGEHMGVVCVAFDAPPGQVTAHSVSCAIDVVVYSAKMNTRQLNSRDMIAVDFMLFRMNSTRKIE